MIITMKNKTKLGVAWGQSYEYTYNILHLLKDKLPTWFLQSSLSYEHQGFIQYTDLLYGERFRDSQMVGVKSTHVQCTLQENSRIVGSQLKVLQSLATFPLNSGIKGHQPYLQCTITEPKKKKKLQDKNCIHAMGNAWGWSNLFKLGRNSWESNHQP